jgi:diguanylate cyclase (GGDEF)-like protein
MKNWKISFRWQIMSLLGSFVLLVGFLSFRSTLKFLENEKIASIREVQTLKIEKAGFDVAQNIQRLSLELSQFANPGATPSDTGLWQWVSVEGQPLWHSPRHSNTTFKQIPRGSPGKIVLQIDAEKQNAQLALEASNGLWVQGIVSSESILAPIRSLNQGPIRALVLDLSPIVQGSPASKHVIYSTVAPRDPQFLIAQELLQKLPENLRRVSLPSSADQVLNQDTLLLSWNSVPLPELARPLQVLSFASRNDVYAAFKRFLFEQLFLIFLLLGASIFVALKFSNYLSRPLEILAEATQVLKTGDFNTHVDIKRRDEIGTLAEAFNKMSEGLRQRDEALRSAQSSLSKIEMKTEVMKKLSEFTGQLAKSLNFEELKLIASRGVTEAFSTEFPMAIYFRFDSETFSFVPDTIYPTIAIQKSEKTGVAVSQMLGFDYEKSMETGIYELNTSSLQVFDRYLKLLPEIKNTSPDQWKAMIVRSNKARPHGLLLFHAKNWNSESAALLNRYQFVIESTFDNATIHEEIKEVSMRDGLTGLFNVRHFKQLFLEEIRKAQSHGSHFSFLFFDVDHFKKFNDTHGHPAGDRVLKQVAALMREFFNKETDILARYGGEEFVVLIKDTVGQDAMQRAEIFRAAVERDHFEGEETQPLGKLTVSIGVSAYPTHGKTMSEVIQAADDALYEAKKTSRNTVVWGKEYQGIAKPNVPKIAVPKFRKAS